MLRQRISREVAAGLAEDKDEKKMGHAKCLSMWRRLSLQVLMTLSSITQEMTVDWLKARNGGQPPPLTAPEPKGPTKEKTKKQPPLLLRGLGRFLEDSKVADPPLLPKECIHQRLQPRASGTSCWWTCVGCNCRWQRTALPQDLGDVDSETDAHLTVLKDYPFRDGISMPRRLPPLKGFENLGEVEVKVVNNDVHLVTTNSISRQVMEDTTRSVARLMKEEPRIKLEHTSLPSSSSSNLTKVKQEKIEKEELLRIQRQDEYFEKVRQRLGISELTPAMKRAFETNKVFMPSEYFILDNPEDKTEIHPEAAPSTPTRNPSESSSRGRSSTLGAKKRNTPSSGLRSCSLPARRNQTVAFEGVTLVNSDSDWDEVMDSDDVKVVSEHSNKNMGRAQRKAQAASSA